ncbi:MAG: hypothetical protein EOP14_05310 [Pseudomonas sp.]|nr:MAG: hypothetical protein EOP14_05310 [Pseudomonas sp.]
MDTSRTTTQIVRRGFDRACADYTKKMKQYGFSRHRARFWIRSNDGWVDVIHFHRYGISYGAPLNNSVSIRVHFASHPNELPAPIYLNGPSSTKLRDSNGDAYHLIFDALSLDTYDRCLEDLVRVTLEHGFPWFASQRVRA